MKNINTILFDLDGTLLPLDIDIFLNKYFKLLTQEFSQLAKPDHFIKALTHATEKMIKNNGEKTNKEVFIEQFFSLIKVDNRDKIMKKFDEFYNYKFTALGKDIEKNEKAVNLIELIKEKKYDIVIATNPLFPLKAIRERIKWAGLNSEDFKYITSYENMHYAKPNKHYYLEILDKISSNSDECIMVGNDIQEDIIAKKVGIKSLLINNYKIDRDKGEITPDWEGSLTELINYFKKEL